MNITIISLDAMPVGSNPQAWLRKAVADAPAPFIALLPHVDTLQAACFQDIAEDCDLIVPTGLDASAYVGRSMSAPVIFRKNLWGAAPVSLDGTEGDIHAVAWLAAAMIILSAKNPTTSQNLPCTPQAVFIPPKNVDALQGWLSRRALDKKYGRALDALKLRTKLHLLLTTSGKEQRRNAALYREADPAVLIGTDIRGIRQQGLVMARMNLLPVFNLLTFNIRRKISKNIP